MDLLGSIQCKAFGYVRTRKNVTLAEAKIPPITSQLKFLGSSYVTRAVSNPDHPVIRSLQQMARVLEDPAKVLGGKLPWIYTCYPDVEPIGHLVAKDVTLSECSFPYQTLLVTGSVSLKEGEEAKTSPSGSSPLNENIGDLLVAQKLVGLSCVTAPGEIGHPYRTTKLACLLERKL
jgi:hypothetical protein